jgi:hypothetical protein
VFLPNERREGVIDWVLSSKAFGCGFNHSLLKPKTIQLNMLLHRLAGNWDVSQQIDMSICQMLFQYNSTI